MVGQAKAQALADAISSAANIATDAQGIAVTATKTPQGNSSFEGFVWSVIAQVGVQAATSAIAQMANAACPKRNRAKETETPTTPQGDTSRSEFFDHEALERTENVSPIQNVVDPQQGLEPYKMHGTSEEGSMTSLEK